MCTSKILTDLCFTKQRIKTKNTFAKVVCNVLVVKICQITKFKKYFKQILVPFKIYPDFECNLKSVERYEEFQSKNYQDHILCSFAYKHVCVDDKITKPIVVFRGENAAYEFIEKILKEFEYCKKVIKKHFNKNLIMSDKEQFRSSNTCWISEKLIDDDDEKVRGHCHVTGKFRGTAHWRCNINLQLIKKVPVTFHNLRGKIEVIPDRLEKCMGFF